MEKEGTRFFFNSQNGKVNIFLLFSIVLVFVLSLFFVNAVTITQVSPDNGSINSSRTINFSFNVLWQDPDQNTSGNCSVWTNITGTWAEAVRNSSTTVITNSSTTLSVLNFTFDRDGNFTWAVGCHNRSVSDVYNFSANITLFIDTVAPAITLDTPKGGVLADANAYNITSYETATFYVNVSDNSTNFAWIVLNTNATVTTLAPNPGLNETNNRSMTAGTPNSAGVRQYLFNLSPLLNFNSTFTSPGPHGVSFCANDTFGRLTCTNKSDYIIMGMNVTQMENIFTTMQQGITGLAFGGLNITLGNGTEIPAGTFMNPITGVTVGGLTHKNFTFIINFTPDLLIHIVAGSINEDQFANASNTQVNSTPTTEVKQQLGTGFTSTGLWADISSFIPSEVSYQYGIIQVGGAAHAKKIYCNGTTMSDPQCHSINQCNATVFGILNHSIVIPTNDGCWLESGVINGETLKSGFTYLFVTKFSGGYGPDDFGPPNATFVAPVATAANHRLNRSTAVTQLINFTIDDTQSTGLNLSANYSINVTITLGGIAVANFTYINHSSTNLSCYKQDNATQSPENVTHIWCNATYSFNSNGTYLINITGRDTSNNSNAMNTTSNYVYFTVDQIPPVFIYYNFTNASSFNTSSGNAGTEGAFGLGTSPDNSRAQGDVNTGVIFAVANWTDNLTQSRYGQLQFYNISKAAGQEWQTLNITAVNGTDGTFVNGGWTNFSFPIPKGHNEFEGENVSFRIVANDTVGNINKSATARNITIQINDTTLPTTIIPNGTVEVNGTNITDVTPTVSWRITEHSGLTSINVSIDKNTHAGTGVDSNCGLSAIYTTASGPNNVERNRNGTFTVVDDATCTLANGTHFVNISVTDSWNNTVTFGHAFNVQSATPPALNFVSTTLPNGKAAINQSNITPYTAINFTSQIAVSTQQIKNLSFTSSCNSTVQNFVNLCTTCTSFNQSIYPFNYTSCKNTEANQTVTVTVADFSGNSNSTVFGFLVDDIGPSVAVTSPSNGLLVNNAQTSINITVKDNAQALSFFGYYLDGNNNNLTTLNISDVIGGAGVNVSNGANINITPVGTRSIKLTANDTLGNVRNSSVITFTIDGPISFVEVNNSLNAYATSVYGTNFTNVTIRVKSAGTYILTDINDTNAIYEIGILVNNIINVTLTDLNGSAANWQKINFTPIINDTSTNTSILNNWTNTILRIVSFNDSIQEFISNNNSYYGIVTFPLNISGDTSTAQEFWWLTSTVDVRTRTNISSCTAAFTATTTTPCWNYTSGGRTLIFVPHYSVVAAVNDSSAPTINVTLPLGNQTVSMPEFFNITVSSDAQTCRYQLNSSTPRNVTMSKSGTVCLGQTERFKNLNTAIGYNVTFWVTDNNGNTNQYIWRFNISDTTSPNNGVVTSSGTTTGATITITGTNESVNATVNYGTANTSLSSSETSGGTDFNVTQTVTISSLATVSTATTYHYNITVCDFNGNCKTNGTFTFTQTATAAAAAAASTTSSGGGGGGGAAAPSNVAAETSKKWDTLAEGSSAVLTINNANIAVTGVVIDVKSAVTNAEVKVASLTTNPLSAAAAAKVYQYLQLTKGNIADTDASKITVNFRVPKSWLSSNNVAESDVVLYRFSDSKWNALSTAMAGSDANNVLYSAVTPGFSTFAIGSKEAAPAAAPPAAEVPAEAPPVTGEVPTEVKPEEKPAAPEAKKPGLSTTAIAWIVVALIVVAAAVGYYMMQKKKE